MEEELTRYFVVSPDYTIHHSESEPDYGPDVVEVETDSARSALLLGVREMQRQQMRWVRDNRWDGKPPWAGIRVEKIEEEPADAR